MTNSKFNFKLPQPNESKTKQPAENKPAAPSKNGWGQGLSLNSPNKFLLNLKFAKGAADNKSNFPEFNFGTGQTFQSNKDPKEKFETALLGTIGKNMAAQGNNEEGGDDAQNMVSIDSNEFAGEESDEILINHKCNIFVFTPSTEPNGKASWTQRGSGPFHLNKTKEGKYRIVIRREPLLQAAVNTLVTEHTNPKLNKAAIQCCFIQDEKPTLSSIRFKDAATAKEVFDKITEVINNSKK